MASALFSMCLLSVAVTVRASCSLAENTSISLCTNPFLGANAAALLTDPCEIQATIECTSGDTTIICINNLGLTTPCKQALVGGFDYLLTVTTSVCTYDDVIQFCPTITRLDQGSSAGHIGVSYALISLASVFLCVMFTRTFNGYA